MRMPPEIPKDEAEADLCTAADVCKRTQPDLNCHMGAMVVGVGEGSGVWLGVGRGVTGRRFSGASLYLI